MALPWGPTTGICSSGYTTWGRQERSWTRTFHIWCSWAMSPAGNGGRRSMSRNSFGCMAAPGATSGRSIQGLGLGVSSLGMGVGFVACMVAFIAFMAFIGMAFIAFVAFIAFMMAFIGMAFITFMAFTAFRAMVFMGCWPALVGPLAMAWKLTGRGASWHWTKWLHVYNCCTISLEAWRLDCSAISLVA